MSKNKNIDVIVPKYKFAPMQEGDENVPPVKRQVYKTMEVTENFTVFAVFEYLAKMEKAIMDKQAEIDGLQNMKEAYIKELAVIEEQLGIENLEAEFRAFQVDNSVKAAEDLLSPDAKAKKDN